LNVTGTKLSVAVQSDMSNDTVQSENNQNWQRIISKTYSVSKMWFNQQENKDMKLIMISIMLIIGTILAWYIHKQRKEQFQQLSQVRYYRVRKRTTMGRNIIKYELS